MTSSNNTNVGAGISRRNFLQTAAGAGAGLAFAATAAAQGIEANADKAKGDDLKIGLIGFGSQGYQSLVTGCLKIPGVRFIAVCDIWEYRREYATKLLMKYKQEVNTYVDYREMLDKEPDLDAVIVATPDFVHSEQTVACLRAGKHVYCEKEMSNSIEGARQMVLAARETGKLLQIGHQRRSNPRYLLALKMIEKEKFLGRITHFHGQWNRAVRPDLTWPKGKDLDPALMKQFGYDSMQHFSNWRWYKKYSGGPISDLGSHQVDIFSWFLGAMPKSVIVGGGADYYEGREWYDNIMTIYEFPTAQGMVRGTYQVLNTTSHGGFYETFMGDEGSMVISEDSRKGFLFREFGAKTRDWEDKSEKTETTDGEAFELKIGQTIRPDGTKSPEAVKMEAEVAKPVHQLHLENFFNAIRTGSPLSCPGEIGFETCVAVLRVNDALEGAGRHEFKPEEFKA